MLDQEYLLYKTIQKELEDWQKFNNKELGVHNPKKCTPTLTFIVKFYNQISTQLRHKITVKRNIILSHNEAQELTQWLEKNCVGVYYIYEKDDNYLVNFSSSDDALKFKLVWG